MNSWFSPDSLVLACVILVMLAFIARAVISRLLGHAESDEDSYGDFLFASHNLTAGDIRKSMAATNTAFATVFFWFIALGGEFGFLLFLIPISHLIGNWLFTKYAHQFALDIPSLQTIDSFVRTGTDLKSLQVLVTFIVLIFLIATVLVEIVIGSIILDGLIPNAPGGPFFFILILATLSLVYVIIGGFRAVIMSDSMQLYLTVGAVVALGVFAIFFLNRPTSWTVLVASPVVGWELITAFVVSVLAVQFFGPPCFLQNWQRIASSTDYVEALKAHRQGAMITAVLWTLMIMCALLLFEQFSGSPNFEGIFTLMKEGEVIAAYAIYPILFVGFIAALVSTADSALSGVYLVIYDNVHFRSPAFKPKLKHNILIGIGFLLLVLVVYFIAKDDLRDVAFRLIYMLFNQMIVIFPLIMYLLISGKLKQAAKAENNANVLGKLERISRPNEITFTVALAAGWLTVFIMSLIGYIIKSNPWTMFASGGGVLLASLLSAHCWYRLWRACHRPNNPESQE